MSQATSSVDLPLDRVAEHLRQAGVMTLDLTAELINGGRSNLTYRVTAEAPTGPQRWVLRRPPLGHVLATAHDVGRESRVIAALAGSAVPVPGVITSCQDPDVIGAPFFIMDYVEGDTLRTDKAVAGLGGRGRAAASSLVAVLAALHDIDPVAVGLGDFGRPEGFMTRQVARWRKQLDGSRSRQLLGIDELGLALTKAVPEQRYTSLIHGDYRLDNCLIQDAAVAAVLDWEMATLGDPLADLALFAVYSGGFKDVPGDVIHSPAGVGTFPAVEDMLDEYVEQSGRSLDGFGWYLAFAWFKLAVILEGIHYRSVIGKSVGDEFQGVADVVPHAVERGRAALGAGRWV